MDRVQNRISAGCVCGHVCVWSVGGVYGLCVGIVGPRLNEGQGLLGGVKKRMSGVGIPGGAAERGGGGAG